LAVAGGRVYLAAQRSTQYALGVFLYRVSLDEPGLERIFEGGTRRTTSGELVLVPAGDGGLLLRFGDGVVAAFDDPGE
jgi:hypothetical protein